MIPPLAFVGKALRMKQVSSPAHGSLCCAPPASARWPPCPRLKCFPISWLPKTRRLHPVLSLPWARRSRPFQEPCFVLRTGIRNQDAAAGCPHHCRGALASRGSRWPEPEEGARAPARVHARPCLFPHLYTQEEKAFTLGAALTHFENLAPFTSLLNPRTIKDLGCP